MKAFGCGDNFISNIKLLYTEVTCKIKIAGGLSIPLRVKRGIRQGCPLSGQLYSIVIEPLLCKLRRELTGLQVNTLPYNIKLSAYTDDVTVIIRQQNDIQMLKEALKCYGKASSAVFNWGKCDTPVLVAYSGQESRFYILMCIICTEEYNINSGEGLVEKVCALLSN